MQTLDTGINAITAAKEIIESGTFHGRLLSEEGINLAADKLYNFLWTPQIASVTICKTTGECYRQNVLISQNPNEKYFVVVDAFIDERKVEYFTFGNDSGKYQIIETRERSTTNGKLLQLVNYDYCER